MRKGKNNNKFLSRFLNFGRNEELIYSKLIKD